MSNTTNRRDNTNLSASRALDGNSENAASIPTVDRPAIGRSDSGAEVVNPSALAPPARPSSTSRRGFLMNTIVSAASLATATAVTVPPTAAAASTAFPPVPVADSCPAASLARAEEIVDLLRTRYIREGWKIDEAAAEHTLAYCRRYAADGSDPDDGREAAIDFFYTHGQSLDWVFHGSHGALICKLAAHSKRANSLADAELSKLADEYIAAERKHCELYILVDEMGGQMVEPPPEALRIRPRDLELDRKPLEAEEEFWRRPCDIGQWRFLEKLELESDTEDRLVYRKVPASEELRLRAAEIVTAFDEWTADRKPPRGYKKAEREMKRARRAYRRLGDQIASTRTTTIEGMCAKIRCASATAESQEMDAAVFNSSCGDVMAISIFEDLMRLGGMA
jgi:hypothetical protein